MLDAVGAALFAETETGDLWFPVQGSTFAPSIDFAFYVTLWLTIIILVPLLGTMIYFMFKYARRPGHGPLPSPHHSQTLELSWSIIPIFIVIGMFLAGVNGFMDMRTMPEDAMEIKVTAKKWAWSFQYPNGAIKNELHVPINTNVVLNMRSDDVIHSLFLPTMRAKQDVVPGRYTKMWFNATKTGKSTLFCTEYCGTEHSHMLAVFEVHEAGEYDEWARKAADVWRGGKAKPLEVGQLLYNERGCAGCHSIDGSNKTGPTFKNNWGKPRQFLDGTSAVMDENYVRESILEPAAKIRQGFSNAMPTYKGQLEERDLGALAEFIKSLK